LEAKEEAIIERRKIKIAAKERRKRRSAAALKKVKNEENREAHLGKGVINDPNPNPNSNPNRRPI